MPLAPSWHRVRSSQFLGDTDVPQEIDLDSSIVHSMRHERGFEQLQCFTTVVIPPSRSDRYGGHNLMLSHGYCLYADSWNPTDFSGDVAEYINMFQNFSHDQFAGLHRLR